MERERDREMEGERGKLRVMEIGRGRWRGRGTVRELDILRDISSPLDRSKRFTLRHLADLLMHGVE